MSSSSSGQGQDQPVKKDRAFWSRFSWRAVLLGFVVDYGGTRAFGFALIFVAGFIQGIQRGSGHRSVASVFTWLQTTPMLAFSLTVGLLFTVAGGFAAGRVAPRERYWNAAGLALIDIVSGFLISQAIVPLWCLWTGYLGTLPCALLGALLAGPGATEPPSPPPLPHPE
jgi:hypothetical protein